MAKKKKKDKNSKAKSNEGIHQAASGVASFKIGPHTPMKPMEIPGPDSSKTERSKDK